MLPLLERAKAGDQGFALTRGIMGSRVLAEEPSQEHAGRYCSIEGLVQIGTRRLIPERKPAPGEQYRFHFDMTKCVGCKCCVVACNEQNGNPGDLHWRRVGEIEGGLFPDTRRWHLSMGCNHCLEPSCLIGCPVEAYAKNENTGVVEHNPDICIGCQYCTWNCSYGVPQYNPERGVVGKCDLCHNRLQDGDAPACVESCPQGAIEIEIVNIADWRANHLSADAPGLPSSADSLSTTRITLPENLPADVDRVDAHARLEDAHWPLVVMLTLTQMSVGAIGSIWLLSTFRHTASLLLAAAVTLATAFVSLLSSTLHLGRPVHAYRAVKGWRRSWLSREVIALGSFANIASVYAACLFLEHFGALAAAGEFAAVAGAAALAIGIAGIYCSARIYLVPARPAWNSTATIAEFLLTGCLLGPLLVRATGLHSETLLAWIAAGAAVAQLIVQAGKLFGLRRSSVRENRASGSLLLHKLRDLVLLRFALLIIGGLMLPLSSPGRNTAIASLLLALFAEGLGRWLFFVSVVPKNMASSFLSGERAA